MTMKNLDIKDSIEMYETNRLCCDIVTQAVDDFREAYRNYLRCKWMYRRFGDKIYTIQELAKLAIFFRSKAPLALSGICGMTIMQEVIKQEKYNLLKEN